MRGEGDKEIEQKRRMSVLEGERGGDKVGRRGGGEGKLEGKREGLGRGQGRRGERGEVTRRVCAAGELTQCVLRVKRAMMRT